VSGPFGVRRGGSHVEKPYSGTECEKLILRDHLAIDRTILANERTLLAYIRTALAVVIVAFSLIKFFHTEFFEIVGWALLPVGVAALAFGIWRYRKMQQIIRAAEGQREDEGGGGEE
jgi:putative membrane protein